jgi:hypothetical protein
MRILFSLIPIYGLAGAALAIASAMSMVPTYNHATMTFQIVVGTIIAMFGIISTFNSVFNHVAELGKLVEHKQDVTNAEEYLTEAKEHIKTVTDIAKDLDAAVLAKSDVDHPAVRAMKELTSAQSTLKSTKDTLNHTQGQIAARKAGPFNWVVTLYGEG